MLSFRQKKILKRIAIGVILSVLIYLFFAPDTKANHQFTLNHNNDTVIKISRDAFAIPHIEAPTLKDALYGLGYTHAKDRLWSLNFRRFLATGRVSEFFGKAALPIDKYIRTVGIPLYAEEGEKSLDNHTRELAQAYCDGINSYVSSLWLLPFEFWITFVPFEPFTIKEAIAIAKLVALGLSVDWVTELQRTRFAQEVGIEAALAWIPIHNTFDEQLTVNQEELKTSGQYDEGRKQKFLQTDFISHWKNRKIVCPENPLNYLLSNDSSGEIIDLVKTDVESMSAPFKGSNAWAIHGNYTASGKPILASDPHLANSIPSIWHQASLKYGGNRTLSGLAIPGTPLMFIGKTDTIAWGITNNWGDQADLFVETVNSVNKTYLYKDEEILLEFRNETIKARGLQQTNYTIYSTHHGPILPNFNAKEVGIARFSHQQAVNYSFAWTSAVSNDTSLQGFYAAYQAQSMEEFLQAFELIYPTVNVIAASADNHIGFISAGRYIKRSRLDSFPFVKNGSSGEDEWEGVIKGRELLRIIDPAKGYIINANNKVADDGFIGGTGLGMISTARATRIAELIKAKIANNSKISEDDCKLWQQDRIDPFARDIVHGLTELVRVHQSRYRDIKKDELKISLEKLVGWDGSFDASSKGALVFMAWEDILLDKMLDSGNFTESERIGIKSSLLIHQGLFSHFREWIKNPESATDDFCETLLTASKFRNCLYLLIKSLEEVDSYLKKLMKTTTTDVTYGEAISMYFPHLPFSKTPLRRFFEKEYPTGGNERTINPSLVSHFLGGRKAVASANARMVVGWGENSKSYYSIDTGISDSVFSRHYTDQLYRHQQGEYIEM